MALKNASQSMDYSIRSVVEQKYRNFEFIFVVGQSMDNTLDKVYSLGSKFSSKILVDQDNGIYNALNKGLLLAEPDSLVCVLGAGDFFLHNSVFSQINQSLRSPSDWCISPWVLTKENYEFIEISGDQNFDGMQVLTTQVPLCHQTIFAPARMILENNGFNTNYNVAADRDLIFKLWRCEPPKVLETVNVVYPQGGYSSNNEVKGHSELRRLRQISRLKFLMTSSKKRRNLLTKVSNPSKRVPNNIFSWCPLSIKEGVTH